MQASNDREPKASGSGAKKPTDKKKKTLDTNTLVLFERQLRKAEKNMSALASLVEHFERSGFDKTKYSPQFQDIMGKFAKMMSEYTRTEYDYEGPYNSEQTGERYKASVAKSWKHKPEKPENADKAITEDEIKRAHTEYMEKREGLAARRVQNAFLTGINDKPMITGPDGKTRYDFVADAESSDEDDDQMISRVVGGDPNPGKNDSAALKIANAPVKTRNLKLIENLKERGSDQFQEYSLEQLDDVRNMQRGFLEEDINNLRTRGFRENDDD